MPLSFALRVRENNEICVERDLCDDWRLDDVPEEFRTGTALKCASKLLNGNIRFGLRTGADLRSILPHFLTLAHQITTLLADQNEYEKLFLINLKLAKKCVDIGNASYALRCLALASPHFDKLDKEKKHDGVPIGYTWLNEAFNHITQFRVVDTVKHLRHLGYYQELDSYLKMLGILVEQVRLDDASVESAAQRVLLIIAELNTASKSSTEPRATSRTEDCNLAIQTAGAITDKNKKKLTVIFNVVVGLFKRTIHPDLPSDPEYFSWAHIRADLLEEGDSYLEQVCV